MDFKKATDELFARISHDDLADALGVSVASIRQARLALGALARREPPANWEHAAAKLAEQRAERLIRLASNLRK